MWRALVHTPSGTVWNRHGSRLTIERCFRDALEDLRDLASDGLLWADCEALKPRHDLARGTPIVLDAIPADPTFTPSYTERRLFLESLGIQQERFSSGIHIGEERPLLLTTSRMVCSSIESLAFYRGLRARNRELGTEFFEGGCFEGRASDPDYHCLPPNRAYSGGSRNRFSKVEVTSPPRMTSAIGCSIS